MKRVLVDLEKLKALEWAGEIQSEECCPVCQGRYPPHWNMNSYGHKAGCWLDALLKENDA